MARKPVQIDVASNTRDFEKGIKSGVIKPLEGVEKSLEQLDNAGADVGESLEQAFKKAQHATEDLADEHKELARVIERESKTSYKKFADNADDGVSKAKHATDEFKDEAKANFSEVASSFTGDMDSAIDLVQGTLGGLVGSIPGVGIALGAVGAVAGVVYNSWKESTEKSKQRVQDMYDDMIESGAEFLSKDFITKRISDIVSGADGAAIAFGKVQRIARDTGISQSDLLLAFAGDLATRNRLIGELEQNLDDVTGASARAAQGIETQADRQAIASQQAIDYLKASNGETAKAAAGVDSYREAVSKLNAAQGLTYDDMLRNQGAAIDSLTRTKGAVDGVAASVKAIPSSVKVRADIDFDIDKWHRQIQRGLDAKQFRIFADAYTAPNRNGKPTP